MKKRTSGKPKIASTSSSSTRKLLIAALVAMNWCKADIFDSFVAYRQGNNALNEDPARFPYQTEQLEVPYSVDDVFAQAVSSSSDNKIHVVHCYSMRNGLYGNAAEARVFWTQLDFSQADYRRSGHA